MVLCLAMIKSDGVMVFKVSCLPVTKPTLPSKRVTRCTGISAQKFPIPPTEASTHVHRSSHNTHIRRQLCSELGAVRKHTTGAADPHMLAPYEYTPMVM